MNFEELKELCLKKLEEFPQYKERCSIELFRANIAYENDFNLVEDLFKNKERISNRYVIPFFLGLTRKVDLSKPLELKRVKEGNSGGLDIDNDFSTAGKPLIKKYLEEKYGKERVVSVGTYSFLGLLSSLKDILRKENIDFKTSTEFCSMFDSDLSWEENIEKLKVNKAMYKLYQEHKESLDMTPKVMNKIRGNGVHAGGVCILDKPVYEIIPVMRVASSDTVVTAFTESGSQQELDEVGVMKMDILAISVLDVMRHAIDMIDEKLYRIKEDGKIKIVSESYIDQKQKELNL